MKTVFIAMLVVMFVPVAAVPGSASELPRRCFRSVGEAVSQQAGSEAVAGGGYRLADIRRDAMRNKSWAMVESCGHPEQPALAVELKGTASDAAGSGPMAMAARQAFGPVVIRAGATVRLVRMEANVRLEVPAVAQANGALGERVRVRVVRVAGDFGGLEEQVLVGVVKSPDVLEME